MASLVGVEITTKLTIYSRDADWEKTEVDADDTPTAAVEKDEVDWLETDDTTVTNDDTGVYSFAWTPDEDGEYEVQWVWEYDGTEYSKTEKYTVKSKIIGVSEEEVDDDDDELEEPDIGVTKACKVTGTFYDASGNYLQGVYVRFTPLRLSDAALSSGTVAMEVTASSDKNGLVELYLLRGMSGMLTITGVGMAREVKVPDVGTIDIMDLAALGDDLLEVQRPQFVKLPRRS